MPYEPPAYSWTGLTMRLTLRALVNPRLAVDLLRTAWAFRRRRWPTKPPFLPIPDRTYLRWRMYTAYADEDAVPPVDDAPPAPAKGMATSPARRGP